MATKLDIELHYDRNQSEFFNAILGESMTYSCADWRGQTSLYDAQVNKFKKMCLYAGVNTSTKRILDLGCGWGMTLNWLAQKYPNLDHIHGVTISPQQARYIRQAYFDPRIQVIEDDMYNLLHTTEEKFYDSAISVGSFEHLASPKDYKSNRHIQRYRQFFQGVSRSVSGNLALQTIVAMKAPNHLRGEARLKSIRFQYFIAKYIFPNALTPTHHYIESAIKGIYQIDRFEINSDEYERTIQYWRKNLMAAKEKLNPQQFEMFLRYFDLCIEHFGLGNIGLARYSLSPV